MRKESKQQYYADVHRSLEVGRGGGYVAFEIWKEIPNVWSMLWVG